jgi:hypothetical protein
MGAAKLLREAQALGRTLDRLTTADAAAAARRAAEWSRCQADPAYFADAYCRVLDEAGEWVPFRLWDGQRAALAEALAGRLCIWLKARQLGLSWLALALALHTLLTRHGVTVLLFSLREDEAKELLERLKGMYGRLPAWMRPPETGRRRKDAATEWRLPNGSRAKAFPSNRGDSYTAALAIVDEADLIPDLDRLLGSVKPTVDAGGRLLLVSRADKARPESAFKRTFLGARSGANGWRYCFLPWHARPDRTAEWYAAVTTESLTRTGSLDEVYEQYPATAEEALAPRSLDKRIPAEWLARCVEIRPPLGDEWLVTAGPAGREVATRRPALAGLTVWAAPAGGCGYVIGADPAEGNPTSDESAACVLDASTGEQVALLAGRFEPRVFAEGVRALADWYNRAGVLVERNNHGHAVLGALSEPDAAGRRVRLLDGHDGRPGWLSNARGKALLYTAATEAARDGRLRLRDQTTWTQLASIEGATLRAPKGMHDDRADACALALVAASGVAAGPKLAWKL